VIRRNRVPIILDAYTLAILTALQGRPMYLGSVRPAEVARRRVKGRLARAARRLNRR
jgi:hypothetical protein